MIKPQAYFCSGNDITLTEIIESSERIVNVCDISYDKSVDYMKRKYAMQFNEFIQRDCRGSNGSVVGFYY